MTTAELERIAANVVRPADRPALCLVESGGRFGPAWLLDGRRRSAPVALFEKQRDAHRLYELLTGVPPTSRSAVRPAPSIAGSSLGDTGKAVIEAGPLSEAPDDELQGVSLATPAVAAKRVPPRSEGVVAGDAGPMPGTTCASCGGPLEQPLTGRPRLTCSDACRQAYKRHGDVTKLAEDTEPARASFSARRPVVPPASSTPDGSPRPVLTEASYPAADLGLRVEAP